MSDPDRIETIWNLPEDVAAEDVDLGRLVRIEGYAVIDPGDDDSKLALDALEVAIAKNPALQTLNVFTDLVLDVSNVPDLLKKNRRWAHKRIGLEDIRTAIEINPGITEGELVDRLYTEHPWTKEKRTRALYRLHNALRRLSSREVLIDKSTGVARFYRRSPSGGIMRPDRVYTRLDFTHQQKAEGTRVLLKYFRHLQRAGRAIEDVVRNDPTWLHDVLLEIITTMKSADGGDPLRISPPEVAP